MGRCLVSFGIYSIEDAYKATLPILGHRRITNLQFDSGVHQTGDHIISLTFSYPWEIWWINPWGQFVEMPYSCRQGVIHDDNGHDACIGPTFFKTCFNWVERDIWKHQEICKKLYEVLMLRYLTMIFTLSHDDSYHTDFSHQNPPILLQEMCQLVRAVGCGNS